MPVVGVPYFLKPIFGWKTRGRPSMPTSHKAIMKAPARRSTTGLPRSPVFPSDCVCRGYCFGPFPKGQLKARSLKKFERKKKKAQLQSQSLLNCFAVLLAMGSAPSGAIADNFFEGCGRFSNFFHDVIQRFSALHVSTCN